MNGNVSVFKRNAQKLILSTVECEDFSPWLMKMWGEFKGKTDERQHDGRVFLQQLENKINKIPVTSLKPHPFPELKGYLFKGNSEKRLILYCTSDCLFPEKWLSISLHGMFFSARHNSDEWWPQNPVSVHGKCSGGKQAVSFLRIRPRYCEDIHQYHSYVEKEVLYFQSITLVQLLIASWIITCKLGMLAYSNMWYF